MIIFKTNPIRPERHPFRSAATWLLTAVSLLVPAALVRAQTTPNFGPNVYIIDPSMSNATIQTTLQSLANEGQFSTNRHAVLFKPGTYAVQSEVGYYESIAGLGTTPQSVTINGYLTANETDSNGNLTDNFWRSLENMTIDSSTTYQWGVSQGAAFRRMVVDGPLQLTNTNCGEASGGFIADTVVTGNVNPCSQQQWYTRNSSLGSWSGGVWNMVFSGVQGAPNPAYPGNSYTVLPTTPVSREKAFLYVDNSGNYNVYVPTAQTNSSGPSWLNGSTPGYSLPISTFFIAQPSTPLADINTALAFGQNLILTPGIYQYSGSINVTNPNTIVLGMGYATLVPQTGTAAITVADVDGVQLSGLLIDAGPVSSPVLLQVGAASGPGPRHAANPTSLNDVFFRIGGATTGSANTSLEVDSDDVILDNIWAWRADHGQTPVGWTVNVANHGLVVNGNNVTALGLAVEHYEQNQVVWNGNNGETIFYQSELPYDVPSQAAWMNGNVNGYSSYSVSPGVSTHAAFGLGVYSFFNQSVNIVENSGITVPDAPGVTVTDAVSVFLSGSGSITHVVNNTGTSVQSGAITSYLPFYEGVACGAACLPTPANLVASTISPTQINLAWTETSAADVFYNVYRSTTPGFTPGPSTLVTSGAQTNSFADTTASPSTTYYYVVQAHNASGLSALSSVVSGTTPANGGTIAVGNDVLKIDSGYTGVTPPSGWLSDTDFSGSSVVGSSTTHAITIPGSLANPAPQAVYQTNRHTNGGPFSYTATGLSAGGSYIVDLHFAELFYNTTGSRKFNVAINNTQVLSNFDIVAASGGQYTANVQSFNAVADTTGKITITFSNGSANNAQVNGIEIGLGNVPVPAAPTSLSGNAVSGTQVNLTWNASTTGNVVYEVFRSTTASFQPSPTTLVTTTPLTSFSDSALTSNTTYYYLVEASNGTLSSLPSNQAAVQTQPAVTSSTAPAAPTGLTATAISGSQINLLWSGSPTPEVQYQVFRSPTSGFTASSSNLLTTVSATGYSDTSAQAGTTYFYVVQASNQAGNSPSSSQASAQTSAPPSTTPPQVTLTTTAVLSKGSGVYQAQVTVHNTGSSLATNVQISSAALGSATGAALPVSLGNIPPSGTATATITFPSSAGADGAATSERYSGTYTGGSFTATMRAVLP
jgi:fibronectin type 3 domain-containing protein